MPSSRLLKSKRPSGFHVRNWKPTDTVLWLARPGSCRKLEELKKTGKVCVSMQVKDRLRCWGTDKNKEIKRRSLVGKKFYHAFLFLSTFNAFCLHVFVSVCCFESISSSQSQMFVTVAR